MIRRPTPLLAALIVFAACLSDETGPADPATIEKDSATDLQSAPAGGRVRLRAVVRGSGGGPVVRGGVLWTILTGPSGGVLADARTLSDGDGGAEVEVTLGAPSGETTVRAALEIDSNQFVVFTLTALPAPSVASVAPTPFAGGDVVTVTGSSLDVADVVTIAEVPVAPSAVAGDGSSATVTVPFCLTPGAVEIRAVVGEVRSAAILGQYSGGPDMIDLAAGEYRSLSPSGVNGCPTLPAPTGPDAAEYIVVALSASGVPDQFGAYELRVDPTAAPSLVAAGRDAGRALSIVEQFERHRRDLEREIASLPRPPRAAAPAAAQSTEVVLGQRRNFEVCADINCRDLTEFETVRAEAKYVGTHAVIYEDLQAPSGGFDADDYAEMGALFDEELYEVATRAFGAESDVDGDGRVAILLSPVVNSLTPVSVCSQSFVAGFFFAIDVNPGNAGDPRSNQAEVFYAITPDPLGEVTCDFSVDAVRRQVPVTFIHEFQHMISFHQHVMVRAGQIEILWLNEAMSHLAEELGALHFRDLGDDIRFSRFAIANLLNAYDYMTDPGAVGLVLSEGTGTLVERGGGWLFLRWLVDRYGDDLIRRLSESAVRGTENVEESTGEEFATLAAQWLLALYASDLPDSARAAPIPPALTYSTWAFRTTFGSLHEQSSTQFPEPFPLIPEILPPAALRTGTLRSGAGDFYRVLLAPGDPDAVLQYTGPGATPLTDPVPRLAVLRLR